MTTKVEVVFPKNEPGKPSWPYVDYDVEKKGKDVLGALRYHLPEIEFSSDIVSTTTEAQKLIKQQAGKFSGYLVYMTALWTQVEQEYMREVQPVVLADDLYAGSGGLLSAQAVIEKEHLPVVTIASSDFRDTVEAVRLFDVMRRLREARILVVSDHESSEGDEYTIEPLGTTVVRMGSEPLHEYYRAADEELAQEYQKRWISEALKVVEPTAEEILKSARMHVALKAAMADVNADAVTVDCLGLYYTDRLPAYPCLSFFQLNNEGSTGVCEADVDSTLTQLMLRYLTGRPGYVSDPVIDTATDQIIYAHCVATNRVFGSDGMRNPYIIRSHAEDRKGASVQSLLPLGETVTTVKINPRAKLFAVHTGHSVANVDDDKACRTKLAAVVDAQAVLDNYHFDQFSWHRVTCYGDYRTTCMNLARLYGLQIIEEDRRI